MKYVCNHQSISIVTWNNRVLCDMLQSTHCSPGSEGHDGHTYTVFTFPPFAVQMFLA